MAQNPSTMVSRISWAMPKNPNSFEAAAPSSHESGFINRLPSVLQPYRGAERLTIVHYILLQKHHLVSVAGRKVKETEPDQWRLILRPGGSSAE
jgi:hypothetical protein